MPHEKLLCFEEYALVHSGERKTPIWVAEALTTARVDATVKRKDAFHAEPQLEQGERAELNDYRKSGYARGHMAPSGDMSTPSAQRESFSLANMVPQNSRNNSVPWKGIEDTVRTLAKANGTVYIVTGPIYPSSTLPQTIGDDRVAVPVKLYKAIYQPSTHTAGAYVVTNESEPECQEVSIAELKAETGISVFPSLPETEAIEPAILPLPGKLSCSLKR